MKYIFILLLLLSSVYGSILKSTILSIDNEKNIATIKVDKVDVGMSGFVVHEFAKGHSSILKNAVVESFDSASSIATLKLSKYVDLESSALPRGRWSVKVGDSVSLAFGYTRALLIAPNSDVYNKITRSAKTIQWLHPDIFASALSTNGHPTPIKEDFEKMSVTASVGLFFIYLDSKLYTLDARSFKILNISDLALEQTSIKLPFYSRVDEIDAAWWGEGSDELEDYEPHYYSLMISHNSNNKKLFDIVKNGDEKLQALLEEFDIEDEK